LLQEGEILLVREDTVIAPIYFYAGINFYRPDEITGIYANLLDEHPIWTIKRIKRETK